MDESLNARFLRSSEPTTAADTGEQLLTRAQKKNARKKQKKKEKRSTEVGFEIEEITTGFGEFSVSEKPPPSTGGRTGSAGKMASSMLKEEVSEEPSIIVYAY